MKRLLFALVALTLSGSALAVGSLADVSVYDRSARRALPVYWSEGRAFVAGAPGNEYAIRIRNRSGTDLLAVVSVDGVNAVTGQTASPAQSGYVIPARGYLEITGWRKSLDRVAAFYFTDLGDSYAARTGRPENVGVIGVAVFKRKQEPAVWLEKRNQRDDAQPSSRASEPGASATEASGDAPAAQGRAAEKAAPAPSLGTGHGRNEASYARYVEFERESDAPNETIAIRYDSRANLIALGVIPAPRPEPRVEPDPFPAAFVPDPPMR
jgi:hypothetical protein